jgi:hypothetical protein
MRRKDQASLCFAESAKRCVVELQLITTKYWVMVMKREEKDQVRLELGR